MPLPHSILIAERARIIATRIATWLPFGVFAMLAVATDLSRRKIFITGILAIVCWLFAIAMWIRALHRWRIARMRLEQSNIPCERCHYLVAPEMTVCPECGTTIDYQGLSIKWAEARLGYSSSKRLGQNLAYGFMAIAIILLWLSGFVSGQRMSPVAFCLFLIVVQGPAMLGFIRISIFPAR